MTFSYRCYHVPESCQENFANLSMEKLLFKNKGKFVELIVPTLDQNVLNKVIDAVKSQQEHYLTQLRTNDLIEILNEAVLKWLNPQYEKRKIALELLPVITGYDEEMIRLFLGQYLRQFRKEKLQRMIEEDFPNPLVLDEFRPRRAGGLVRAFGPALTTHIFSGNVPALPLWSMTASILLKSAIIGKVSSAEPLFPVLFAETIQEIDPMLANTMSILWWKGGNEKLEQISFSRSEAVIAYGSKATIEQISKKVPANVRFQAHGQKVSFGVITSECLAITKCQITAKLAAHDVSWFDQQGCLSPHVFFVERGGGYSPRDFAQMLAAEMDNFELTHSRAELTDLEQHAIVKQRTTIEFESYTSDDIAMIKSENTAWTVVFREDVKDKPSVQFPFSPLNRFVTVIAIDDVSEIKKYVNDVKNYIQTIGVGCSPEKFHMIITHLGQLGANRICALGSMPHPQAGWHHDGKLHLADLVRFCDVEATLEVQMDQFDPNRE